MAFKPAGKQAGKNPEVGNITYVTACICCL